MGSKAKVLGLEEPVIMSSKRWEEVVDGLLRIVEVQGKSIEALAKALEVMGGVVVAAPGEEAEGETEEEGEGEAESTS